MQAFTSINSPETGETLDRGIALRFPGPASFTGQLSPIMFGRLLHSQLCSDNVPLSRCRCILLHVCSRNECLKYSENPPISSSLYMYRLCHGPAHPALRIS